MKFLLINTNQIVQKLVEISAKKAGADLTTIKELNEANDLETYDYVIIDDDCLEGNGVDALEIFKDKRKCLIHNKQTSRIEGFNDYIQKPFLPTSILDVFMAESKRQGGEYTNQIPEIQNTNADNVDFDKVSENLDEESRDTLALDEDIQTNSNGDLAMDGVDENQEGPTPQTQDELLDSEFTQTLDSALSELGEISELSTTAENKDEIQTLEALQEANPKETEETENIKSTEDITPNQSDENKSSAQSEETDEEKTELSDSELALDELNEDTDLENLSFELDLENLENDELNVNLSEEIADLTGDSILNANLENELDGNLEQITTESNNDSLPESEDLPTERNTIDESMLEDLTFDDLESLDSVDTTNESKILSETNAKDTTENDLHPDELLADLTNESTQNIEDMESLESIEAVEDSENTPTENTDDSESESEMDLDEFSSSILDSEQIQEVSQALNALEASPDQKSPEGSKADSLEMSESIKATETPSPATDENTQNDFSTLKEPEIAQALGEEFAKLDGSTSVDSITTTQETDTMGQEIALDISQTDIVKNIITSSVQNSISSLSAGNLKAMLDGLEVTINISFKDKSK